MQSKSDSSTSALYDHYIAKIFKWNVSIKIDHKDKINVDRMKSLSTYFGNPENQLRIIHVAGTNGKGTVSLKTARVLEAGGYKAGLFTSPHISSFRERISINRVLISKEDLVRLAETVFEAIENEKFDVTFFEIVSMIALLYFVE